MNDFAEKLLKETIFGSNFFHLKNVHIANLSENFSNPYNRQTYIIMKFLIAFNERTLIKDDRNNRFTKKVD